MIATNKFVFVHLPRSGGTFITGLIKKFFPSAHDVGHHLPREFIPREYANLPVFGTVRNPWAFYVSLYHYLWPKDAESALASWMTENGKHGFEGSTRNLLNLGIDDERLDALIELLPDTIDYSTRHIPGVAKAVMNQARGTGIGYYTLRFKQMFGDTERVTFCRLENLQDDLLAFLEKLDAATNELRDYISNAAKVNAAEHLHYSSYYTPELAALVGQRDREIIDRFGYIFESLVGSTHGANT